MDVAPGTVIVWSDISCPFAHVAVSRLHRFRADMGLQDIVRLDHRAFPLELVNNEPTNKATIDGERPALAEIEPQAGWSAWTAPVATWPVTTLPALEAVQAAKEQGLAASEELDRALRVAFFAQSRCISLRPVILEIARECPGVNEDALAGAFDEGRGRSSVVEQWRQAERGPVHGSPHVFLPDGSDRANPGLQIERGPRHAITVTSDAQEVYRDLLQRVSGAAITA